MKNLLDASFQSAKGLFDLDAFRIPMYQREYAWSKDEYSSLWTDLQGALEEENYFLGLIILTQESEGYEVVDGQQRIVSISLLAAAVRDMARIYKRESLAGELDSTFLFALDYDTDDRYPKVEFSDEADGRIFLSIIKGTVDLGSVRGHQIAAAYEYFMTELEVDLGDAAFKRLGAWAKFLQHDVSFASFVHPDSASAYTVFEVINERGKELTPADLLKNNLLSVTPAPERDSVYARWKRLASEFDDSTNAFVQYVRHVAMVRRGYILPKELYRRVTSGADTATEMPALLGELESNLEYYLQIRDPNVGGPASDLATRVFAGFQALGVSAVRPLLLALGPDADLDFQDVLQLIVRIAGVGTLGAASLEQRFSEAAVAAAAGQADWRSKLLPIVPDREEFEARLPRQKLRRPALQLLLRSVHQQSVTPEPEGHVQLIRPAVVEEWKRFDDDEFAVSGMTIGNAALSAAARRPRDTDTWPAVQSELLPDMHPERQHLALLSGPVWTPAQVRQRGASLATEVSNVWY